VASRLHNAHLTVQENLADVVYQATSGWYVLAFWPAVVLAAMGPVALTTVWRGVPAAVRKRGPLRVPFGLLAFFVGVFYLQNLRSGMTTQARYGVILVWLLTWAAGGVAPRTRWLRERPWLIAQSLAWLLLVWGLAEGPFGPVAAHLSSVSPRPRATPAARAVAEWVDRHAPTGAVVLGPLQFYSPVREQLDGRLAPSRLKQVGSAAEASRSVRDSDAGVWIVDRDIGAEQGMVRDELVAGKGLRLVTSAGPYDVYQW
jgi:hypothetical protein